MPRLLLRLWARTVPLIYRGRCVQEWEAELVGRSFTCRRAGTHP